MNGTIFCMLYYFMAATADSLSDVTDFHGNSGPAFRFMHMRAFLIYSIRDIIIDKCEHIRETERRLDLHRSRTKSASELRARGLLLKKMK